MRTVSPEKRNSLGSLTAWLPTTLKSFATDIPDRSCSYAMLYLVSGLIPRKPGLAPQDRLGLGGVFGAGTVVEHEGREEAQGGLAGLHRPDQHPLGRGVSERMQGADLERAGLRCEASQE